MQTIFIGFNKDATPNNMQAIGIRISYLLTSQLIIAGDIYVAFDIKEKFRTLNFEQRVNFINSHGLDLDDEDRETSLELARLHKASRKIKIKTKEQIVHEKKAESLINAIFEAVLTDYAKTFDKTGLPQLKDIFKKPGMGLYRISYEETEIDEGNLFPLSKLLQLKMADEVLANPTVMFLNWNLLDPAFVKGYKVAIPRLKKFNRDGFLWPLLEINNFNFLSVSDLNAIMVQVNDALNDFKKSADCFINLKSTPREAFKYLEKEVNAKAGKLQAALNQSDIIKSYKERPLYTKFRFRILMGLLPWQTIYKYFTFAGILHGKTAEIIAQSVPPETLMPVLVLELPIEEYKKFLHEAREQEAPLTLKKSLKI